MHVLIPFLCVLISSCQLSGCPRSLLESDRVLYLETDADRLGYEVEFLKKPTDPSSSGVVLMIQRLQQASHLSSSDCLLSSSSSKSTLASVTSLLPPPFDSTHTLVSTGSKGWIFVIKNGKLYAAAKRTDTFPRLHHR